MDLAELDKEYNRRVQEKQDWYNGGFARDLPSNLTPPQVFGFIDDERKAQEESSVVGNFGTSVMNGVKGSVRGLLGSAKAAIDYNIAEHQKNDPNYRPYGDFAYGISNTLQSGIDSLQREEVKADSAAGQLVYDLTEGAVQLIGQYAVTAMTGGWGGAAYMGATVAGDQYLELRKDGVDVQRAAQAGLMNAPFQAALEKIGMGKLMAKLPVGTGLKKKLGEVVKRGFEEGITEGLQELPEQFTNIWAKDKNATAESMAQKWGENWEQNVKEAGYSALLGGILGGAATGVHIIADSVRRNVGAKINEVKKEQLVATAEKLGQTGVNPEYMAAAIDANSQGETISVQAKDLQGFFQQTNGAKLAETLKVSEEDINRAAELGEDIDITKGNFMAAMVENKGLYEATKDGMYFGVDGELSVNAQEVAKELHTNRALTEELSKKLDEELDAVIQSATTAGMSKAHAEGLRTILEANAMVMNPENPAAYLEKHKLRFENGGKTAKRGWLQRTWGKRGWKQNSGVVDKGQIRPQDDGTYIIDLFKDADASTVIHETGHYFVDTMINEAIADPSNTRLIRDAKTLLEYGGMTAEQWRSASMDEKRAAHEKFAEAFETYIMEGKAPSAGLRRAFQRFAKWLTKIYSKIARSENAADINDDVRGVFDRMLASQEEIEVAAKINGMFNELPAELTNKLSDSAKNSLQDKIAKAKDKAVNILTREMMKNFGAERKAARAAYIAEIKPKIEELVHRDKVNQARDLVGYHFGSEQEKNNPYFKDDNGMAHANAPTNLHRDANPSIVARKYRHAIGSVLPNYNDVLQDTRAAIDDRLNPIIEDLKAGIDEYNEAVKDAQAQGKSNSGYWTFEGDDQYGAYEKHQVVDPTVIKDYMKKNNVKKLDDNTRAELERDGYVFHPAAEELSGTNWYANYVEENGKKKLSNKELARIARDIYGGTDLYGYYDGWGFSRSELEREAHANKEELDELYRIKEQLEKTPEGVDLVKMAKRSALSDEQRVTFEAIAEEVGYSSGDEMAQDILAKPSERQMVRDMVNEAVQARYPDIYAERELAAEKAREALYNERSGEVIALEQQLIEEYAMEAVGREMNRKEREDRAKAMKQLAENKAKELISQMTIDDIIKGKGRRFALAERRAAANAQKAIKAGEIDEAMEYKRQQLINHELYRQALVIRSQADKAQKFVSKINRMAKDKFGTQQHFNQVGALLARMGIQRRGYDAETNTQSLTEYVDEMRSKCGEIVDIPDFVLDERNDLSNAGYLSYEHFTDVIDALKNIMAIAKYDTRMTKLGKEQSFEDTKKEIMDALSKLEIDYVPQIGTPQYSRWQKFKNWNKAHWQANRNADNFYLALDNWSEGFFTKSFFKPLNRCADAEAEMQMNLQQEYETAYLKWAPTKEARNAAGTKIYYEELGASISKDELIQMVCNLGNEGNARRLCETPIEAATNSRLWVHESELISREQAAEMTRQNLVEFLGKHLTKADIEYAQAKIDACNKLWPKLQEVNIRTKGFSPKAVEATPVVFKLANGESAMLKGGYFPLVRDTQMGSAPAGQNRIMSTDETFTSGMSTLNTTSGSSQARTNARYPVSMVAGCEINAINDTIHDIAFRETILDLRKLLNDEEIFREMKSRLGESNLKLLRENIEICANPRAYSGKTVQAEGLVNDVLNWMRTLTVNSSILGNIKTSLQNFGNIFLYARSVEGFGYADTLVAMKNAIPNHAEIDQLCQKSVFMRERMIVPEYSLREINSRGDLTPIQKKTLKWGAYMLSATDMATAKPVWAQAYSKKLNEGKTEAEAIEFADTVIRRTLGSSRIYDVASIRRGSDGFKLLNMFQGFFNTQFNQWEREFHIVSKLWKQGDKKDALLRISAFLAGKWLAVCLANIYLSLENPFERDKDGYLKLTKELVNYPLSMGGPIAQATNIAIQNVMGMRNYGYRFTPVQATVDNVMTIARLGGDVVTGEDKEGAKKELAQRAFRMGANIVGIPSSIINLLYNLYDIGVEDEMDFELRDLISRRPKSERKKENELLAER